MNWTEFILTQKVTFWCAFEITNCLIQFKIKYGMEILYCKSSNRNNVQDYGCMLWHFCDMYSLTLLLGKTLGSRSVISNELQMELGNPIFQLIIYAEIGKCVNKGIRAKDISAINSKVLLEYCHVLLMSHIPSW